MTFVKGQSGNPAGRPKGSGDVRAWAHSVFQEHGRESLTREMKNHGPRWFQAVELVMAYAYGKPQQFLDLTSAGEQLVKAYVGIDLDAAAGPTETDVQ